MRTLLRAAAEETPVPPGLEVRLLERVGAPTTRSERRAPPPDAVRRTGRRPVWLAPAAAAAAALLVIGSATWATRQRNRPEVAGPTGVVTGVGTVPWDASAMERVDGLLDTPSDLPWADPRAGTPDCTSADLRVVSTRSTGSDALNPTLLTTQVGVQSVSTSPCTVDNRGQTTVLGPDGAVIAPSVGGGSGGRSATGAGSGGLAIRSVLVPAGHVIHLQVAWWDELQGVHPTALRLNVGPGGASGSTLSVDVSGVTLPTPGRTSDVAPGGVPEADRRSSWNVTSIAAPGTLSSLTAETVALAGGWFGPGPTAASLRLTNDSGTAVSLRPCPDLLVRSESLEPSANRTLRGPLECGLAPASIQPGDQLEIELLPPGGNASTPGAVGSSPDTWKPMTAQLARGDDVVTATSVIG